MKELLRSKRQYDKRQRKGQGKEKRYLFILEKKWQNLCFFTF